MPQQSKDEEMMQGTNLLEKEVRAHQAIEDSMQRLGKRFKLEQAYRAAMHETAVGLLKRTDLNDLLEAIVTRACALAGTQHGYLHLYEPNTDQLVLKIGLGRLKQAVDFRIKPGVGFAGKVWQNRQMLMVENYAAWPERDPDPRFDNLGAVLGVPLKSDADIVGVIGLAHFEKNKSFKENAIEILLQLAEIASLVLRRTINYTDLQDELLERRKVEAALKRRLDFERIVSIISSKFVASNAVGTHIEAALASIGHFSNKSRVYLFLFDAANQTMSNTQEWCADGVVPQIEQLQNLPMKSFPWIMPQILEGEIVEIEDVSGLSTQAINEKKILEMQEIKSLILVPMRIGEAIKGFIGFDDTQNTGPWSASDVDLLQVVSNIIGSTLQREQTEAALSASEKRFRGLVEDMPALICRFLPDSTLTFVNSAYCKYFNKNCGELIGQKFLQFIPRDEQEKVKLHYLSLNAKKPTETYDHQVVAPDGSLVWQEWTNRALFDQAGKVSEYQSIGRDITEKRKMEAELQKIQKLESLGVLAGGIAHDFNNFLTGIVGNISLAKMEVQAGKNILNHLIEIENASMRARDLTQQLLTFSKGGEPVKEIFQIEILIEEATRFALRGSNVRCHFHLPDGLWPLEIDGGQIGQVINNLVLNADQSMPGGGELTIRAENTVLSSQNNWSLPAGRYVHVSIQDQGVGISRDHLNNIFDPYFSTKQKGSGLGLTIAYSIIDKHNGRLTVVSELGVGSVFSLYLPAAREKDRQEPQADRPLQFGRGRILVMDDEAFIRDVAAKMLKYLGYDVALAGDGEAAIDIYRRAMETGSPFDAVILDLTVPGGMGGQETIKSLKNLDSQVNAIVSSGYSNDPIISNHEKFGFKGMVTKPYRMQEMSEALGKLLG